MGALIIITGQPGTGKTTLGRKLSEQFGLPFFGRDTFKELIFDSLGWSDREWSRKVGATSYAIMDYVTVEELKAGRSCILETNFDPVVASPKFQGWQRSYGFACLQILLHAQDHVVLERYRERALSGERHAGHVDVNPENVDEVHQRLLQGELRPLDIEGDVIRLDTSQFSTMDSRPAEESIRQLLGR